MHHLAGRAPSRPPLVNGLDCLPPAAPQSGSDHQLPQRFAADVELVFLCQVLAGQRRAKATINFLAEHGDRFGTSIVAQLAIGRAATQSMNHSAVADLGHPHQQSSNLAIGQAQLARSLPLRNQSLECFLEHHQAVSVALGHG